MCPQTRWLQLVSQGGLDGLGLDQLSLTLACWLSELSSTLHTGTHFLQRLGPELERELEREPEPELELEPVNQILNQNLCSCRSFSSVCRQEVLEDRGEAASMTQALLEALQAPPLPLASPTDPLQAPPPEPTAGEGGDSSHRFHH